VCKPDDGGRTDDKEASDITVASLADADQSFLSAAAVRPWCQPEPGRELAARSEKRGVRHSRCDRARRDRTDPRDRRQSTTDVIAAMPRHNTLLDLGDLGSDDPQLINQAVQRYPGQLR
jgi:hypothetical protein